ncbi:MAG: SDR family NAD(P)-dependent oxidoreductase [Bacteroidota bacterium]
MNYYYITGTSRGIGKALAILLLLEDNNYVIGLSRTNTIEHERYEHLNFDLSNLEQVENYNFIDILDAEKVVLINNAGMIGDIKNTGNIDNQFIHKTFMVNTISPAILMNNFLKAYGSLEIEKNIINISSGAGRHPIESWSSYCASKSALDMFSTVVNKEQYLINKSNPVKVFSIAPGIVDTQMQDKIREADKADFSKVDTFVNYKNNNQLDAPTKTADLLIKIIQNPQKYKEVLLDVRDVL